MRQGEAVFVDTGAWIALALRSLKIVVCEQRDLDSSWIWFQRCDLHKLSAVDATSFAIMKRLRIGRAFAFDHHFVMAGFRLTG